VIARRVQVSGRVQGVGFRWATMSEGLRLGLAGWVRNLADGSVEAHLQGPEVVVESMLDWLRDGPPGSSVRRCSVHPAQPETGLRGFEIRG
jgi:acylphosphatase